MKELNIPIIPIIIANIFTAICGKFLILSAHIRKNIVPITKDIMFQGYTEVPIAFSICPVIINAAPIHCNIPFIIFTFLYM